ncbi:MAG: hypothetical protein MJ182_03745 [Treponema sp.]|nr:hypothetical protein [Treponema sp.]
MKKSVRVFSLLALAFLVSFSLVGITACKNWMTGNLFEEIENEVKVASAEEIEVYVRFADNNFGTVSAKCAAAQLQQNHILVAKQDVEMEVSAIPNNTYGFKKWAAFSSSKLDPKKNISSMVFDDEYMDKFGINELPESVVVFENVEADTTKCKILQPLSDPSDPDAMIVIVPIVARRATLSARNTYPKTGSDGVVRNQRIVLSFDKPMNFETFVTCKNPSGTFDKDYNGNNIYYKKDNNGNITEYFYDWNRERIQISVYDTNEKQVDEDIAYGYFQLPVPDETNPRKIIISPNLANRLPKFAEVNIVISYDVEDSHGYTLTEAIEYYYMVGQSDDTGAPTFTELSGGRPLRGNPKNNSWSDYVGYLDEADAADSLTNVLPPDSTNIDDWTDSVKNKPFTHRITNAIDLHVIIKDKINSELISTTASDADIDHFAVRARHLLYADGTPGTGTVFENIIEKNYEGLKYHSGAKNFEEGEPGDSYDDPEDGYSFPYYLPSSIPDGLIKLEIYAQDVTGNSGESEPFALYVVKDTSAPDIETQTNKILSASTNTLNEWFNARTINQLAFKVNAATPFSDTISTANGIVSVHPKFMTSTGGSSLFWAFGNAPENMAERLPIDNTGAASYDMSKLVSTISEQGAMTFYAQLSDDMDNVSEIKNIPLKIYYDTILPEAATIQTPQEDDKIYPLTGVAAGASGTFFTRSPNLSLVVSATDSGSANVTDVSSGVAGFLVPTTNYNAETLYEALTASNGNLNGLNRATDGASRITLTAGSEANNSKQNHYIYSVDYALNAAAAPTTVTVVQDTTGPGITLTDNASYTYNAEKPLFKANAGFYEKTVESGISGTVKGVSQGAYYYSNAQTSFPFHVTLNNEFGEFDSGAYQFVVKQSDGTEVARGSLNDDINLSAGTFTIVAYDNLGNETTTAPFTVVQDSAAPEITAGAFHIYGRKFGYSTYNTDTTNYRIVNLQFEAKDIEGTNSGIRKLTFTGASFAGSEGAPLVVVAGDKTLTQGTDYIVQTEAPSEGQIPEMANSHIIFTEPRLESSFRVDNIILPAEDGTKIVSLMATDATGNISGVVTAGIFSDSTAPSITSVCDIALAPSIDGTGDVTSATNLAQINVQVIAKDATSGIKRFYIGDTYSEVGIDQNTAPGGISLVSAESKVLANGVELPSAVGAGYIELLSPSISSEDVTYTITNVNVPDTSRQGTKTVYVVLYDNTELRNQNAVSDTIIYDTTGPAIIVEDNASNVYNAARPFYRTTDTEAFVAAQTGLTGRVNGLYEGIYYYNASEPGFNFTVSLADENTTDGSSVSGAHIFYIDGNEAAPYQTGTTVTLAAGTHTISAKDKLGNVTTSRTITVDQDIAAPNYGGNFKIHGRRFNENDYNDTTSNYQTVYVTFTVSDTTGTNTGIRSLTFTGAAFNDTGKSPEGTTVPVVVKADGNVLSRNTHYIIPANQSAIIFTEPRSESSFQIENITFSQEDGNRTISLVATDATRNAITPVTSSIYLDTQAPEITSVTAISTDVSIDGTNDNTSATKSQFVNVQIVAKDPTSGIKRIYIGDTASRMNPDQHDVPGGNSLLSSDSKVVVNGTELPSTKGAGFIELVSSSISSEAVTYIITNVKLPHSEVQGIQEIFVVLFDDTKLRNQNSVSDTIIYDTTGPAIVVTDGALSTYDGTTLKKYRSNDTLNDVTAATDGNGNVTGIVTGSYYYSMDESAGFKFNVALVDQNVTNNAVNATGTASGAYRFYIGDASGNIPEGAVAYESGAEIFLTEGTYTLVAKDKLGNTTKSKTITVVQDKSEPSVSDVVIHGTIFNPSGVGNTPSTTATKENNVYVTFKTSDMNVASNDTGLLKVTLTGDANFDSAKLYEGDTAVTAFKNAGTNSVDFWFASPITTEKTFTVKDVILTDSDGNKTITVKASDRTAKESSGVSSFIFKDVTAPTVSDVVIISTDKDALQEDSLSTVTNDEKITVLFKAYDVTSGIKKITICDANGNSLLTTGADGSVVSITHNGEVVVFNGTVSASEISLLVPKTHKSDSAADPFIFEVTNVSMPKVDGNFVQGKNYFLVKVYDDVLNVAPEAAEGSIIFDNVPPKPIVDFSASHFYNPKKSREQSGNSFNCYISDDGKVYIDNRSSYAYFKAAGDDSTEGISTAGFWKVKVFTSTSSSFTVTDPLNSTTNLKSPSDAETSLYRVDEGSNKYTKIYVFDAIGNCTELVSGVTEFEILDDNSNYYPEKKPVVSDYEILKAGTNTRVEGYLNTEDTPVIDIMFKAMDQESGISYFDFYDDDRKSENDNIWNQIISGSPDLKLEVSDDNGVTWKTYKEGAYDYDSEQHYSSVAGGATYNAEKGYFVDETGNLDPYVYFHNYATGGKQTRAFAFYEPLKPNITYKFKISNISLENNTKKTPDVIRENWDTDLNCNVYVYDCVQMGNSGLEQKIIWDTQKPVIKSVDFVASSGANPNYTSESFLSNHDLVITYDEPNDSTYGGGSGIQEIQLELATNVGTVNLSTVDLLSSSDLYVYTSNVARPAEGETASPGLTKRKGDKVATSDKTSSVITISDASIDDNVKGSSKKLYIRGLTIAGGDVDQIETIKVTLKDRAGNVSDNTGNTNNIVQIGYDKTAPIMYPVSGNTIVDGKLARSYFKTVFGKPTVLSLHHATSNDDVTKIHKNASIDDNMVFNIFPEPGDLIQNYGEDRPHSSSGKVWEDNADLTELVLRFNKNGSGISIIKLAAEGESVDFWDFRRILFNPKKVQVSIDEGEHWYSPKSPALPYDVTEDTLTFTDPGICPKGENCSVMIKGVMPNFKATYTVHNWDGDNRENIWWSDVIVTSFAGKSNAYHYVLALADDVDTPEFTRTKISVTDTSSTDGSFTDGKTIQITGRIQANSTGSVYSSGLWAIQLNGAEFDTTANPQLKITISVPNTERRLLLPNALSDGEDGTELTYTYDSTNDYSVRRTVDKKISDSKIDIKPSSYRCSISEDKSTLFLNMPLNPHDEYDFKLSGIKLYDGVQNGAQNISVKLIKYSGLTNDPDDRYWDYDESNERNESYKTMFREVEAYYNASESHRGAAHFAQNRTNSITLDTVPPEITWKQAESDAPNSFRFYPIDKDTVYYGNVVDLRLKFSLTDPDGSGIKGFYFTDRADDASYDASKYSLTGSLYSVKNFYVSGSEFVEKYIHVMDKAGNISTRPVTYSPEEKEIPTKWILDKNFPSLVSDKVLHYWGDAPEKKYVMTSTSSSMTVYTNESAPTEGYFTDSLVEGETGGLETFVEEIGSGIYGTAFDWYLKDIYLGEDRKPNFKWVTGNSHFSIVDNVGGTKSFSITQKIDSRKPELSFYSIYSNKGGNSFWPKSGITLSTNQDNPTVLYLGGTEDEDYIRLVLNAKDTGTDATGIYKVTVNGTELPVGSYGNTVSHLSGRTEFPTDSTPEQTVTWLLGKDESKTEGEENGLPYKITITDWVGNETTYYFKLVSDVTPPVLTLGDNSPFTQHAYEKSSGNKYFTQYANDKQVVYFSEANTKPGLNASGVSDAGSGYDTASWYSDSSCTSNAFTVTFNPGVTPTPTSIFTRDNVGNVLEVKLAELPSDVEDITSVTGNVLYCYASADTTAKLNVQDGQYVDGNTEIALASDTPVKVFTKAAETKVKITPTAYYKINYSYEDSENVGTKLGSGNFSSSNKSVEITVPAGKTYNITIGSSKYAAVSTTYQVQVVQDTAKPEPDNLVLTITKNSTAGPNGANDPNLKSYFDAENWKLYYNTPYKIYPYFTITGITDDLSGPAKIGLNSSAEKPGQNFITVVNGEATDVWGSFTGDQEKALYISDNVGNGDENGAYFKIIYGISDTEGPDSVTYTGDDAVFFVKNDGTIVTNGAGTLTVSDSKSGIDTVVEQGSNIVATDKVGNTNSFPIDKQPSLGKATGIEYTSDSDRDTVIAVTPDSNWTDTWAHRYKFTVSGYTALSKIYILGIGSNEFQGNKVIINGTDISKNTPTVTAYGDKYMAEIELNNATGLTDSTEVKVYSGFGNCASPENLQVFVTGTLENPGPAANILSFIRGPKSSKRTARKSRSVVIPENRDVANAARSSGKTSGTVSDSPVMAQTENQRQTPAAKVSDVTVKKGRQDLRKRAAEFEKSEGIISAIPEIQTVEQTLTDIIEETTERGEITTSENISKEVEIFDKNIANNGDDVYNDSNIAKSVVISIILLLIISCSIIVFWALRKRASGNKKN